MSDYWDEERTYEPEPQIEIPEDAAKASISLSLNAGQIESAVNSHVQSILEAKMGQLVNAAVEKHTQYILSKDSWGKGNFENILRDIISKKIDERYPEIVENKVNELKEMILKLQFSESRNDTLSDIQSKALKKVEGYVNTELAESVKLSREYIEQFAKNYFANNLFRAMGMMDKMLPQTESVKTP